MSQSPSAWRSLRAEVASCRRCPLHLHRNRTVFYRGGRRPRVVFVGEAPGAEEDRRGEPFVGRSGARLDAAIRELGLGEADVGIVNLIKCRPPANRFPPGSARACRPFLDRQLAWLAPRVVVTLGRHALASLDPEAPRVLISAGVPRRWNGVPLYPMIHPAAALRSRGNAARWSHDLAILRSRLPGWLDQTL